MSTKSAVMDTTEIPRRRHRSWPEALKREIVAASFEPGCSVSTVARRYDVNANQVFSWRRRFRAGSSPPAAPDLLQLVPVMVAAEPLGDLGPAPDAMSRIEIDLAGGYRIRVGSGFASDALRQLLDVLERR